MMCLVLGLAAVPARADSASALADGLKQAEAQQWVAASVAVNGAGPLAGDLITWLRLRAGKGLAAEYPAFIARRPDWPGLALLLKAGEPVVAASGDRAAILRYFEARAPATGVGALALARAYRDTGDAALADAEAVRAWQRLPMEASDQAGFNTEFRTAIEPQLRARLDAMLWGGQIENARRMLPLVGAGSQALALARIGLMEKLEGVDRLVAAVPADRANDPGLAHARFMWRISKDRYDEAADLVLERSTSPEALGDPLAWAEWRARLARRDMREGNSRRAYAVAAQHFLTSGNDYIELEWLAGYIALQKLGDPALALQHFQRVRLAADGEISLGRAGYWEGRAQEALGDTNAAHAAFAFGAKHQTGFYGLLSAERIGLPMDARLVGTDQYPDWKTAGFMQSSVVAAAMLLQRAGDRALAKRFFLQVAEGLSPVELGQLADLTLSLNEPHIALLIAKQAALRGVILQRAYYPLTEVATLQLPVPVELALAVARRESEFDPAARSSAGAMGLMQVMPGTAKLVAPRIGLNYAAERLVDPGFNVRIGTAYLAELQAKFGTSPLLVASGYNAGPGRPRRWIAELGDPRAPGVDPVDWIEAVPFAETRTYIMRVTESMLIYRARLAGKPVPITLTDAMKGR